MVQFYDDLIDNNLCDKIHSHCQGLSWYHKWYGLDVETKHRTRKLNEYIPLEDGNGVNRHILSQEAGLLGLLQLLQFSSYRHPIAWDTESLQARDQLIWSLWTQVNDNIFDGKATLEGAGDKIDGLKVGIHFYKGDADYYKKYNVDRSIERFTTYFSARASEPIGVGQVEKKRKVIHRDGPDNLDNPEEYFTVLFVVNRIWKPSWGGEFIFYSPDQTRKNNVGWPNNIIGNKPGRIIVYNSTDAHKVNPPTCNAHEMTQRIGFRVRLKS